jgi:DNA-binding MarR family transcriptional regulator
MTLSRMGLSWAIVTDSPGSRVGLLLRLAHQRAARAFSQGLMPLDIEGRHYGVLHTLAVRGPLTQAQLIAELHSDKSSMLRTVDDLERLGLVERKPVPGDRRARRIELTETGRQRYALAVETAEQVTDRLLAGLTPQEQRTLCTLLARFVEADEPRP